MEGDENIKKAYESILQHDFEKAIEWFEQAVKDQPTNADFHYKLSITYARSNKLAQAIEHAEKAMELDPKHEKYKLHIEHLQSKMYMKQAEKALQDKSLLHHGVSLLKQAIALDPLAVEAFVMLGTAQMELSNYKEAVEAFREALKLDPQSEEASALLELCKQTLTEELTLPNENNIDME